MHSCLRRRGGRSVRTMILNTNPCAVGKLRLLKAAARHCFWNCTAGALDLACGHLGLAKGGTVFARLVRLLQHLLGPLEDDRLLFYLNKRVKEADENLKALLQSEEMSAELTQEDAKMVKDPHCVPNHEHEKS